MNITKTKNYMHNLSIPGSVEWASAKNQTMTYRRPINRNNIKFEPIRSKVFNDWNEHALRNDWDYNHKTNTWTHPYYTDTSGKQTKFSSIYQYDKKPIPFAGHDDSRGIAYNYSVNGAGSHMTIYQNRWKSEEFDTRKGKRRLNFEKLREEKKKFLMIQHSYDNIDNVENN